MLPNRPGRKVATRPVDEAPGPESLGRLGLCAAPPAALRTGGPDGAVALASGPTIQDARRAPGNTPAGHAAPMGRRRPAGDPRSPASGRGPRPRHLRSPILHAVHWPAGASPLCIVAKRAPGPGCCSMLGSGSGLWQRAPTWQAGTEPTAVRRRQPAVARAEALRLSGRGAPPPFGVGVSDNFF